MRPGSLSLFFCHCLFDHGTVHKSSDGLEFTVYPVCLLYLKAIIHDEFRIRMGDFGYFKDVLFPGPCNPLKDVFYVLSRAKQLACLADVHKYYSHFL
jgi:hypothetical protein